MTEIPLEIRRLQPLRPAVLHILLVLAEGERHGYAVKQAVVQRTNGVVKMGPGTLYESIQRMVEHGLIQPVHRLQNSPRDQTQRRYYRLTPFGKQVLHAEVARLAEIVDCARSSLHEGKHA